MKDFKELGISAPAGNFAGPKIKINKILNRQIIIEGFKVGESKFAGKGDCLTMAIKVDEEARVVFTSAKGLMDTLRRINPESFPFKTTIIEENEKYCFT